MPEDYKQILLVANGFLTSSDSIEPSFEKIQEIDYYRNVQDNAIEVWEKINGLEDTVAELKRAILNGGKYEEQQFLIIPPIKDREKWKY